VGRKANGAKAKAKPAELLNPFFKEGRQIFEGGLAGEAERLSEKKTLLH